MKLILMGISIILFGIALMVGFSSIGLNDVLGIKIGMTVSFISLLVTFMDFFIRVKE